MGAGQRPKHNPQWLADRASKRQARSAAAAVVRQPDTRIRKALYFRAAFCDFAGASVRGGGIDGVWWAQCCPSLLLPDQVDKFLRSS